MNETLAKLDTRRLDASITEGRMGMCVENLDARVAVQVPEHTPLSENGTQLALSVSADGVSVGIELDAAGVDALADAIHHAREGDR